MTTLRVDQALYGYSDGHRLLAGSRPISGPAGRLLRAMSDMAFDGKSHSYLTVLPIAELKAQAFIRSWPGPQDVRPGSVWSHILLVDFVDLGQIRRVSDLLKLFTSPNAESLTGAGTDAFTVPAELQVTPSQSSTLNLNWSVARELVGPLYSTNESVSVVADIGDSERALLAIFEQQWPRLRRTFSFRTRSRSSANPSYRFDIEVVERARSASTYVVHDATWIDVLIKDLQSPDPVFRELLRTFGAESTNGRVDMPALASVIAGAERGQPALTVLDELCSAFPGPQSMRKLKSALFGRIEQTAEVFPSWPRDELARLALVFETGRPCLDFKDLDISARLRTAWHTRPNEIVGLIGRAQIDDLTEDQLAIVVSATASEASPSQVARLASQSTDLALLIAHENPTIVVSADLWSVETIVPALLDILGSMPREAQTSTLVALVYSKNADAAASVCSLDASLWWDAFELLSSVDTEDPLVVLPDRAASLRAVLERIGPAAVGEPSHPPSGENELVLLAFCANPSAGLWRRASAGAWVDLIEEMPKPKRLTREETVAFRLCALALTAATQSGSVDLRRRAWLASFAILHSSLESVPEADEAWTVLQTVLPREPEWDRCGRLRKASVETVVRDRWPREDVDQLLRAVPEYGSDLTHALLAREERKKRSRGWFWDFIDGFRP